MCLTLNTHRFPRVSSHFTAYYYRVLGALIYMVLDCHLQTVTRWLGDKWQSMVVKGKYVKVVFYMSYYADP